MLEHIRKYTGLMFVILILLFLGLVFFGDVSGGSFLSGPSVVQAHGRGYTQQEYQRIAENPIRLIRDLSGQQTNFQGMIALSRYLNTLGLPADGGNFDPARFLVNRVNLQNAARDYGLHASKGEVEELIQKSIFANRQGAFDGPRYERYVQRQLPRLGMGVQDMNEVLGEMIVLEKLTDLLGAGLQPSRDAVRATVSDRQQEISYQIATFPRSRFEAAQSPTDEEVKTYWEEHQGRYQTEAQRRITYVLAQPDYETLAAEKEAAKPEPPETPDTPEAGGAPQTEPSGEASAPEEAPTDEPVGDDDASSCGGQEESTEEAPAEEPAAPEATEEPAPADEAPAEPKNEQTQDTPDAPKPDAPSETPAAPAPAAPTPAAPAPTPAAPAPTPTTPPAVEPVDLLSEQEREDAVRELGVKLDDLWTSIYENEGRDFEKLARDAGFLIQKTELIDREAAPAELKSTLRDDPSRRAIDAVFQRDKGTEPIDAVSDVRRVGADQWFLFRIDESVEPAEISMLCSNVLPKPIPGSTTSRSRARPARSAVSMLRRNERRISPSTSVYCGSLCMVLGVPSRCMRMSGASCAEATSAR